MSRNVTMQKPHTRPKVIPSDLVICACGAVGEVHVRGWWIFQRYEIVWYESEAGAMLARGRLPPGDHRVATMPVVKGRS